MIHQNCCSHVMMGCGSRWRTCSNKPGRQGGGEGTRRSAQTSSTWVWQAKQPLKLAYLLYLDGRYKDINKCCAMKVTFPKSLAVATQMLSGPHLPALLSYCRETLAAQHASRPATAHTSGAGAIAPQQQIPMLPLPYSAVYGSPVHIQPHQQQVAFPGLMPQPAPPMVTQWHPTPVATPPIPELSAHTQSSGHSTMTVLAAVTPHQAPVVQYGHVAPVQAVPGQGVVHSTPNKVGPARWDCSNM
jgi:hypothetical protein